MQNFSIEAKTDVYAEVQTKKDRRAEISKNITIMQFSYLSNASSPARKLTMG